MASPVPDYIDVRSHRDLEGRGVDRWLPGVLFALLAAIPVLALLNVFGQDPDTVTATAAGGEASLALTAPTDVRGGLLVEARFDIRAKRELKDAVLVLDSGWFESMTVNTIEPAPAEETSRDGSVAFDIGSIPAGKLWRQYIQFQPNPVNVGSQSQGVTLYDGNSELLHIDRKVTVYP